MSTATDRKLSRKKAATVLKKALLGEIDRAQLAEWARALRTLDQGDALIFDEPAHLDALRKLIDELMGADLAAVDAPGRWALDDARLRYWFVRFADADMPQ